MEFELMDNPSTSRIPHHQYFDSDSSFSYDMLDSARPGTNRADHLGSISPLAHEGAGAPHPEEQESIMQLCAHLESLDGTKNRKPPKKRVPSLNVPKSASQKRLSLKKPLTSRKSGTAASTIPRKTSSTKNLKIATLQKTSRPRVRHTFAEQAVLTARNNTRSKKQSLLNRVMDDKIFARKFVGVVERHMKLCLALKKDVDNI